MIAVLADDFSGAAEVAGSAFRYGLAAEVQVGALQATDCDLLVLDTNTRSCSAESAAETVAFASRQLAGLRPEWLYKKIDSLLRGPVGAEIDAVCRTLALPRCLLVNANPRKGRCVIDGRLLIADQPVDQTEFAHDPEYPRQSSLLSEILSGSGPAEAVRVLDAGQTLPDRGVIVGNTASADDLLYWARSAGSSTLLAGAAEFFEAVLQTRGSQRTLRSIQPLRFAPTTLLVCGSTAGAERRAELLAELDVPLVRIDEDMASAVRQIRERLVLHGACAAGMAHPGSPQTKADRLHERLIGTVAEVLSTCPTRQLWIEGGRTASALIRACGWKRLLVDAVYADGVVGLRSGDSSSPTLVVKPGSYAWPVGQRGPAGRGG